MPRWRSRVIGARVRPHGESGQDGEETTLHADLVVDAMGRRSKIGGWLTAAGGRPPAPAAPGCGLTY